MKNMIQHAFFNIQKRLQKAFLYNVFQVQLDWHNEGPFSTINPQMPIIVKGGAASTLLNILSLSVLHTRVTNERKIKNNPL